MEAASLAWEPLGWKPVWFSEIEPFPCEVLRHRFPGVPNLGDMTKIKGKEYAGHVDLLVGGTPCQDLSVAGKRAGLAGERSSLAIDFVRLAYEMECRWFVWENVPGCLSSGSSKGADFATLLSLFTGRDIEPPKAGWGNAGYVPNDRPDRFGIAWRTLDVQFTRTPRFPFAIPQRRRRVFVVGYFGDWTRAAEVLLEPSRLQWDTPTRFKAREIFAEIARTNSALADRALRGAGSGSTECFRSSNPGAFVRDECSGTVKVNAASAGNSSASLVTNLVETGKGFYKKQDFVQTLEAHEDQHRRNLVCHEVAATLNAHYGDKMGLENQHVDQGCPNFVICRATQQGNAEIMVDACPTTTEAAGTSGNNQPIICLNDQGGSVMHVESDGSAGTLRASTHGNEQIICVHGSQDPVCNSDHANSIQRNNGLENVVCYENHANDSRITESNGVSPLISSRAGTGGGNLPLVQECYAFEPGIAKREGSESRFTEGFCGTLRSNAGDNQHAVAIAENIIGRKVENGGNGVGAQEEVAYTQNATGVCQSTVRRMLPVECERLMGFPDNWTRIPWRGKPEEDCPDSPRYAACGNSMGVNCMEWIGGQIQKVEDKNK